MDVKEILALAEEVKLIVPYAWRYSEHYKLVHASNQGVIEGSKEIAAVKYDAFGEYFDALQPANLIPLLQQIPDNTERDKLLNLLHDHKLDDDGEHELIQMFAADFKKLVRSYFPTAIDVTRFTDVVSSMQDHTSCFSPYVWSD